MGGWDAPWHWVVLAIVVIALFGYKKLPDAARSVGRSLRIFKTEIKGMSEDDKKRENSAGTVEEAPKQVEGATAQPVSQPVSQPGPIPPVTPATPVTPAMPVTPGTADPSGQPASSSE